MARIQAERIATRQTFLELFGTILQRLIFKVLLAVDKLLSFTPLALSFPDNESTDSIRDGVVAFKLNDESKDETIILKDDRS